MDVGVAETFILSNDEEVLLSNILLTPMTASRRRRRYVRFPALSGSEAQSGGSRLVYPHSPRPPPSLHSGYNLWAPVRHKQPHYQVKLGTDRKSQLFLDHTDCY